MGPRNSLVCSLVAIISLLAQPGQPRAQWAPNGAPVCTDFSFIQRAPQIASDGAGGAIVVWSDLRNGINFVIHAEKITSSGRVAPGWVGNGIPIATTVEDGLAPVLVSDGVGGAIVAWYNYDPLVGWHIYAQRVTFDGKVATGWPANGLRLSDAVGAEFIPSITSDGQGGAIVSWHDYRGTSGDIYAQRVTRDGAISPGWPLSGVLICGAPGEQVFPRPVGDGAGGAIIVWQDLRVEQRGDIYAQHVTASGTIANGWAVDGVAIAVGWDISYPFDLPVIATDNAGGAIIAWQDGRAPFSTIGVHALRITSEGSIASGWPDEGVLVGRANFGPYLYPGIVPDGVGGAFITYVDSRGDSDDIYVQHLTKDGLVAPEWPSVGLGLCTQERNQRAPVVAADGVGGGIVAWMDYRNGGYGPDTNPDVYAQRFTANGRIPAGWPPDGAALCAVPGDQVSLSICSDGKEGAFATWEDHRGIATNAADVYAARVLMRGFVPPLVSIDVMPDHPDNIINIGSRGKTSVAILSNESFDARSVSTATVTLGGASAIAKGRGEPPPDFRDVNGDELPDLLLRFETEQLGLTLQDSLATLRGEMGEGISIEGSDPVTVVRRAGGDTRVESAQATSSLFEAKGADGLAVTPNPARGSALTVSFSRTSSESAALELLDVTGRSLVSRDVSSLRPGRHLVRLVPDHALHSGIYWLRLAQGSQVYFARAAVTR